MLCYLQNLARLLFKAASDNNYVDPYRVEEILTIPYNPDLTTKSCQSAELVTVTGLCNFLM